MPFNNYFNLDRFARLLKQDLLINRTKYFLGILGLGLISYLTMYFFLINTKGAIWNTDNYINSYYVGFFIFYMMAVGVIIGTSFPDLSDKIKTSNYLLTPGSTFEKFLVQFVLRIGLFIPIALGLFWTVLRLAKASLISDLEKGFDVSKIPYFNFRMLITNTYNNQLIDNWQILFYIFGLFSYGTYLFVGATYFKRYALVKTVIASGVIFLISMSFSVLLSHIFFPNETYGFNTKLNEFAVTEHLSNLEIFLLALSLVSWMFFLAIGYFKLKEKEA
jgi:hypothetical protein